jgi:hypothetical protein
MKSFDMWAIIIGTGGIMFGLLKWFANRMLDYIKGKLEKVDKIERNYLDRFEKVHSEMDEVKRKVEMENHLTREHLTNKIEEVNTDKMKYRIEQARMIGNIEAKIEQILRKP